MARPTFSSSQRKTSFSKLTARKAARRRTPKYSCEKKTNQRADFLNIQEPRCTCSLVQPIVFREIRQFFHSAQRSRNTRFRIPANACCAPGVLFPFRTPRHFPVFLSASVGRQTALSKIEECHVSQSFLIFILRNHGWTSLREKKPPISSRRVRRRYATRTKSSTDCKQRRKNGARGGSRTHMRKNPRRILSSTRTKNQQLTRTATKCD